MRSHVNPKLIYVGSTCLSIEKRFSKHKSDYAECIANTSCARCKQRAKVCSVHKLFDAGQTYIILLERYPCLNKRELVAREYYHIRQYRSSNTWECVNIHPMTTINKIQKLRDKCIDDDDKRATAREFEKRIISCDCGCEIERRRLQSHKRTVDHKQWLSIYNFIYS